MVGWLCESVDPFELSAADDQEPVEALASNGPRGSARLSAASRARSRRVARPSRLPAQDAELVAEDEDLDLLALARAAEQYHQLEHAAERKVDQRAQRSPPGGREKMQQASEHRPALSDLTCHSVFWPQARQPRRSGHRDRSDWYPGRSPVQSQIE